MGFKKIKRLFKWIIALSLVALFLNYGSETLGRIALEKSIASIMGLRTLMDDFDIDIPNSDIEIQDLFIFNPKQFKERRMIDIPKIYIDFDLQALFKKQIHFKDLKIDLKEFTVIRKSNGDVNLHSIKLIQQGRLDPESIETTKEEGVDLHFDLLELNIGTVIFIDISKKGKEKRKEYRLNLKQQFKDVDSLESLQRIILIEAVTKTSLDKVLNLNLKSLIKPVRNVLRGAIKITGKLIP